MAWVIAWVVLGAALGWGCGRTGNWPISEIIGGLLLVAGFANLGEPGAGDVAACTLTGGGTRLLVTLAAVASRRGRASRSDR